MTTRHPVPPARSAGRLAARPGPLGRLADLTFRHRGRTVLAWVAALLVAVVLSAAFGGDFKADYSAPGSDSEPGPAAARGPVPAQSGDTVDVVVRADGRRPRPRRPGRRDRRCSPSSPTVPHVASVDDPYTDARQHLPRRPHPRRPRPARRREPARHAGRGQRSRCSTSPTGASRPALDGRARRPDHQQAEQGEIGSEGIGLAAAAIILLLMFGSVVAAGLPILVAVAGLAVSSTLTTVLISFVDAPDWSTSLATMMGIGIGIDYALLMVTRFREWRAAGLDPSGRDRGDAGHRRPRVMVAGSTVVISMLGLFAMGLSFMRGAALVTILAVLVVMLASITLFPALLGYLGRHVDRLRLPLGPTAHAVEVAVGGHVEPSRGWLGLEPAGRAAPESWPRRRRRRPARPGCAVPRRPVRLPRRRQQPGDHHHPAGLRPASRGFGPGMNGPLLLVAELPRPAARLRSQQALAARWARPRRRRGDAGRPSTRPATPRSSPWSRPTGPQAPATEDLVHTLRDTVLPDAIAGTGLTVHVGGVTATSIDSTDNIAKRIPLLIGGVVLLSMLLLLVSFRSVAVAVKAAAMNLLSVAAAYGVVALVLQGGWAGQLVGIDTPTPLPAFVPVLMFAVLFGLSMDYEVFLVSRMREAWLRTGDNERAILEGLAGTGRVITAAAAIMVAVFAAFIPSPDVVLKVIGVGMASAIFIDATVVRMLLVPAVMHLLGPANWWLPGWLDRLLPQLHVEGQPEVHLPAPRTGDASDAELDALEPVDAT